MLPSLPDELQPSAQREHPRYDAVQREREGGVSRVRQQTTVQVASDEQPPPAGVPRAQRRGTLVDERHVEGREVCRQNGRERGGIRSPHQGIELRLDRLQPAWLPA